MTGFDPAELARLAEAAERAVQEWQSDAADHALVRYMLANTPAIVAALTRAQETEKAIERLRDVEPTDREVDKTLIPLGFHPDERYPEYAHDHLRIAYREGWDDALHRAALGGANTTTGDTP